MKPALHVPAVYMPPLPEAAVDEAGAIPLVPKSGTTVERPPPARQMGTVGVGLRLGERVGVLVAVELGEGVRVPVALAEVLEEALPVLEGEGEPVRVPDCVLVLVCVADAVAVCDRVAGAVAVDELERVLVAVPDAVRLCEEEGVWVDDEVGEVVPVRDCDDEAVPVRDGVNVALGVRVEDVVAVRVRVWLAV